MKIKVNILIAILTLLYCCTTIFVHGQASERSGIKSDSFYFESPVLIECNIQFPENYKEEKSYPLVICLHGGGSSYENFRNIREKFENPLFIMATPQAPYKWLFGDKIGYDWSAWPTGNVIVMQEALGLTTVYVKNLINSIKNKYNVSEIYLLGFSQGSIITQIAGINNHDLINGLIIISGPEIDHPGKPEIVWPSEEAIRSANKLEVFLAHGITDKRIDIKIARKSKDIYEGYGYNVFMYEYEGGHELINEICIEIENWIQRQ